MEHVVNREVFNQLSYGLYVVTSKLGDRLNGQLVNTVIQVTSDPPRVAVIINKNNLTHEFIMESRIFGATVLEQSTPMIFIGLFGFKTGRNVDKLSQVNYVTGVTGCPLVTEHALSVLEARVISSVDVGTHTLFVGDVLSSDVLEQGQPLTYEFYRTHLKGKTSRNAPTYNPEKG